MANTTEHDSVLRDLIHSLREYGAELKSNKLIFIIVLIPIASLFLYRQITNKPSFVAKTSFMLNESGGTNSGLASILGQFGIAAPGQEISLQKIIEIAKTRIVAEKVFLSKVNINGSEDWIGNHFIKCLKDNNEWTKISLFRNNDDLENFRFEHGNKNQFTAQEFIALKKLHTIFLKKLETSFNEKSGIMELSTVIKDQELSYQMCTKLFNELSQFYIDKSTEKQQETYDKLKNKVDSIRKLMHGKDYTLANMKDTYRNTWQLESSVPQTQTDRDIRMLNVIYTEALRNLEVASFALQNQTPFVQALDLPMKPLEIRKEKLAINILKILAYTFLISSMFIIFRKIVRDNS